jgi:hypothetical protein
MGPLTIAGMFRELSTDVAREVLNNYQVVNDDISRRGPEASQNVHKGPQLRMERFSIVFHLALRRQTGATTYIHMDNLDLDAVFENPRKSEFRHPRTRMAFNDTRSLGFFGGTGLLIGVELFSLCGILSMTQLPA